MAYVQQSEDVQQVHDAGKTGTDNCTNFDSKELKKPSLFFECGLDPWHAVYKLPTMNS